MIPNTKIFVGSLPARTSSEELRHLFQTYGHVTECDIMNRCGFVHMETADQAENAIKALNNSQFKGQSIVVEPGRMKDKVNKQGQDRGSGARGGLGGGINRPQSNFNRGQQGNRNFGNNQQQQGGNQSGGPMRRDRNFQQNRNQGPYQNRSQDGGNRLGQQSRWQGNNQGNNFDDNIGGGGNYGGGNERLNNSGNNLGNQDRRGFALPGGNQKFGGNNQGSSFNNNPGGNFGGYNRGNQGGNNQDFRGGNQSGNNQGFRGGNVSGNSYGNNIHGGYQNRRDSVPQTPQQDSQFQHRPPYQKPQQQQMSNFGGSPGAQTQNQGQDFNRQNFGGNNINNSFGGGMPRENNSFGQRSNNQFAGGNNQRPQNNNFGGGMQRPQGNGPPRGGNFSGPPHKDNNFGGQKQLNSSYNQAFPPLGAPSGNRNGPRTNMQNNGNNRRY